MHLKIQNDKFDSNILIKTDTANWKFKGLNNSKLSEFRFKNTRYKYYSKI